jgi:hypothetical protein
MPNLYSNCAILTTNCYLYTNSNGSTAVGAGFYSDGSTCWGTNTSGMITGSTTCPTPTPSASPAPTPTPTTQYTITIRVSNQFDASGETQSNYGIYYNINNGSDTLLSNVGSVTTTCAQLGTFNVAANDTLYIGFKKTSDNTGRTFGAAVTTNCNLASGSYCGTLGTGDALYYNYGTVTGNVTIALKLSIFSGGVYLQCV